jgi:hypothetical protein
MAKFIEMDEKIAISKQMEEDIGPVILINKFNVSPEDADRFLTVKLFPRERYKEIL